MIAMPDSCDKHVPHMLQGKFHYIDGEFVRPEGFDINSTVETHNPATGNIICSIPNATKCEVERAFIAAEAVRVSFRKSSLASRVKLLTDLAALIEQSSSRLAAIETYDCGKPLRESESDMSDAVEFLRHTAELVKTEISKLQNVDRGSSGDFKLNVKWEGVGTVAAITPWNFPFLMALQKVGTGFATGCPVVLKPSEYASMSCVELALLVDKLEGLPKGAFQLLLGTGQTTGQLMVDHKLPRKISFTGSVPTGQKVMQACAHHMRGVHLELGGKSAMVVFDDVNLEAAVEWAVMGIFWGAGQVCSATSRILVHENIYQEFVSRLHEVAKTIKVGPGMVEGTQMGPLVARQQFDRVRSFIKRGIEEGLELCFGGLDPVDGIDSLHKGGFYVRPTCFVNVPIGSSLWREEIFGPVLCVRSFKTEEEAIALANDSEYGLGAAVMTACMERASRVADDIEAGSIWVNNSQPVVMARGMPFGGWKKSGFGKEMGVEGLMEWMHAKAIVGVNHKYHMGMYPISK